MEDNNNKWLNVKLGLVNTYGSSSVIQTQESKSLNYDAYEKCISNYVLGLTMLKKQAILLHAQYVRISFYNCVHLFRYNVILN